MNIGLAIKTYRNNLNLTQDELAEKIRVSRQTISSWENSKSLPDVTSLILLSDFYQVSLDELIKGDITMIKKLEVQETKKELKSKFIVNNILNSLLVILLSLLNRTGYENSYVYFFIVVIIFINSIPILYEFDNYIKVSAKNKD